MKSCAELEALLRESEARLERAIAGSQSCFGEWDLRTGQVSFKGAWESLLGYRLDQIEHSFASWEKLIHPDDRAAVVGALQAHVAGLAPTCEIENRMLTITGESRWVHSRALVVERDPQGQPLKVSGTFSDIHRRKLAEAASARQLEFLTALNDTTLDLLNRRDQHELLQAIVERASALLDAPHVELALIEDGALVTRAYAGASGDVLGERATRETAVLSWRAIDTQQPVTVESYQSMPEARAPYRELGAEAIAVLPILHRGECLGVLSLVRGPGNRRFDDIDLQKGRLLAQLVALVLHNATIYNDAVLVAEARTTSLRESEERTRQIIDTALDAVITMDASGCITGWNPRADTIFGWSAAEVVGHPLSEIIIPPALRQRHRDGMAQFLRDGTGRMVKKRLELSGLHRTGREFPLELTISPVTIRGEQHFSAFLRDITERRAAETQIKRQLRHLDAIARISRIAETSPNLDDMVQRTLDETLEIFGADRAWFFFPCDPSALTWRAPFERTRPAWPGAFEQGKDMPMTPDMAESIRAALGAEGPVAYGPEERLPVPSVAAERYGVRSLLQVIVRPKLGAPWLFGLHHCTEAHHYSEADIQLFSEIAHRITDSLSSLISLAGLRESEERFRSVFALSPVPIVLATLPEGRLVEVNAAAETLFGYTRAEVVGVRTVDLRIWQIPEERTRYIQLLTERGFAAGFPVQLRHKNGSLIHALYSGSVITLGGQRYTLNFILDVTAHKLAENSLQESNRRYQRVVANIGDALVIDDHAGRIVYANERFLEMFGLTPQSLSGRTIYDHLPPQARPAAQTQHQAWITGQPSPTVFESEVVRADGSRFWVEQRVTPVMENNEIIGTQSALRDITERRLIERALRLLSTGSAELSGEAFFRQLALNLAELLDVEMVMIASFSPGGDLRTRVLGGCVNGHPLAPFTAPSHPDGLAARLRREPRTLISTAIERDFPHKDYLTEHGMHGALAVPLRGSAGDVIGCVMALSRQPLARVAQIEAVLQLAAVRLASEIVRSRTDRQFQDLFDFAPDAIVMVDREGRIVHANHRAEELFGYARGELNTLTIEALVPEAQRGAHQRHRQQFALSPHVRPMGAQVADLQARRKDGTIFPAEISLGPVESDGVLLIAAAIRDITGQREAEMHLRQKQKIESLGTLAGGIAHDFNNILTGMLGFIQLAHMEMPADHRAQIWLHNVAAAGSRAKALVQQILAFSRPSEGTRLPLKLTPVVSEALRLLQATLPPMVRIEERLPAHSPLVLGDSTQLHQVLMNLGTNAWHALPESGGTILVAVEPVTITTEMRAAHADLPVGPAVRLTVGDTGCGMPPEVLERIFDPFFTTKPSGKGTGLGLAVVHGVVRSHGGAIIVRSTPQAGTTFEIYLPTIAEPALDQAATLELPRGHGESILLVDDDQMSCIAIASQLEHLSYRVTSFFRASEALAAYVARPDGFALVVTDFAMPEMTGLALIRQIRTLRPEQAVLLISGYLDATRQEELEHSGVKEWLRKPPQFEELARAIARGLRSAAPDR